MLLKCEAWVSRSSSSSSKSDISSRHERIAIVSDPLYSFQTSFRGPLPASIVRSHNPLPTLSLSLTSSTIASPTQTKLLLFLKRSASSAVSSSLQDGPISAERSYFLQNSRLRRLCKKGSIQDARYLFSAMKKDSFSWNIMMSACAGLKCNDEVFSLFYQMQKEGMIPNKFIVATILSACATYEQINPGKRMHARIAMSEEGFTADPVVQTALVNLYGRFGELGLARCIFENDPGQDVVLWNAILTVFTQQGQCKTTWILYTRMQQLGILPDKVTCTILLSVCASEASLKQGKEFHSWVVNAGLEDNIVVGTAVINMYSRCQKMDTIDIIFDGMFHRDLILWNAMMTGQALNEMSEEVFHSLNQMQQEGVLPNMVTYTSVLDTCISSSALGKGKLIHACILGITSETDSIAGTALVSMYGRCGSLVGALDIFHKMDSHHDTILWNTMISVYAKHGIYSKAMQLYRQMGKRNISADRATFISILSLHCREVDLDDGRRVHIHATHTGLDLDTSVGNVLVSMYGVCGSFPDALVIFNTLSCQDAITFVNMITACSIQALIAEGKRLHSMIEGTKMEQNVVVGNALVNMYSKCGSLVDAQRMFGKMLEKNVVTWCTIIAASAQHGECKKSFILFSEMCKKSVIPDNITLTSLLVACSHAGYFTEACASFHLIINEHNALSLDHLNCMIDLLGRSASLNLAHQLARFMPFLPSGCSWSMLVYASHIHADMDGGCLAAKYALELDLDDATLYVSLSNIYGAFTRDL